MYKSVVAGAKTIYRGLRNFYEAEEDMVRTLIIPGAMGLISGILMMSAIVYLNTPKAETVFIGAATPVAATLYLSMHRHSKHAPNELSCQG